MRTDHDRSIVGPARLRYAETLIGCLRRARFYFQLSHDALHALDNHLHGFTAQELSIGSDAVPIGDEIAAILAGQRTEQYHHVSEVVLASVHDHRAEFTLVLDQISNQRPA